LKAPTPLEPFALDPLAALLDGDRMRLQALGVEPELDRGAASGGGEGDRRAGGVVAAVVEDVPLDPGGVQRDRLAASEHEQAVAERLQPDRHLTELRPRRKLEPG